MATDAVGTDGGGLWRMAGAREAAGEILGRLGPR